MLPVHVQLWLFDSLVIVLGVLVVAEGGLLLGPALCHGCIHHCFSHVYFAFVGCCGNSVLAWPFWVIFVHIGMGPFQEFSGVILGHVVFSLC